MSPSSQTHLVPLFPSSPLRPLPLFPSSFPRSTLHPPFLCPPRRTLHPPFLRPPRRTSHTPCCCIGSPQRQHPARYVAHVHGVLMRMCTHEDGHERSGHRQPLHAELRQSRGLMLRSWQPPHCNAFL
ncbi:hypothetical protein DUNSADRAFT_9032 [Dunaliella salina]|uniref:Encoded protein n=1 Tax=Dunaliella salina TaxID=3046 RepID=A0ABQ7GI88_DUNSA|nr:hypothetical protein DUNSADRAFT_9032 [Dunaliella salina]|eukprot:KAF5834331.1 hypothetical protein DUNSADRAFT_9032 [Dunaliella salina]